MTATLWLIFARAIGFFARAPGFARVGVPGPLRAGFAFALALALAPVQGAAVPRDAAMLLISLGGEALVGATLGVAATLVAEAVGAAGRLLDDFIGLRASVPGITVAPAGLGGLWTLVFVTAFFALGGAEALVAAFAQSFSVVPLGAALDEGTLRRLGLGFGVEFARLAFELAAPGLCTAACIHLGAAALARVVPRFSHLAFAYPAAYAGVLLAAFASLSAVRALANGR